MSLPMLSVIQWSEPSRFEFFDPEENLISIGEVMSLVKLDDCNIYKWMIENNWKDSLQNAFRQMYL